MTRDPAAPTRVTTEDAEPTVDPALLREVEGWVTHLVRTLKTCRLYDAANPTVVRFRQDLAATLTELLAKTGPLTLDVTSTELLYGSCAVHESRSREDNLAAAFHRDGIRALTLQPGIEAREVDAFLDQIIHVTGIGATDDDLVTLLWDANLPHVEVAAVPLEGDLDAGGEAEDGDAPSTIPWPDAATEDSSAGEEMRSDDWTTSESLGDLDAAVSEIESMAPAELERFGAEYRAEAAEDTVRGVARVLRDALASGTTEADRAGLVPFVERVMREAIARGLWPDARHALQMVYSCEPGWNADQFFAGITGSSAIVTRKAVAALDRQHEAEIDQFLQLAQEFGAPATEWLMQVLAESQQKRTRRPLAETIARLTAPTPERILPWMTDERWYVVRNVVHILGWIGGDEIAAYLKPASEHPESRVRREVVAALAQTDPAVSRPILIGMLPLADSREFAAILHQLATDPSQEVTDRLVRLLRDDGFDARDDSQKRAVYMALAQRGDAVVEALGTELNRGGLFTRGLDGHRQAVALALARIGTPGALAVLRAGSKSGKGGVRKACEVALATSGAGT